MVAHLLDALRLILATGRRADTHPELALNTRVTVTQRHWQCQWVYVTLSRGCDSTYQARLCYIITIASAPNSESVSDFQVEPRKFKFTSSQIHNQRLSFLSLSLLRQII